MATILSCRREKETLLHEFDFGRSPHLGNFCRLSKSPIEQEVFESINELSDDLDTHHVQRRSVMTLSRFDVTEHHIPSCHIREYPRATVNGDDNVLQLAVKQYTPKHVAKAKNTVTIIGAHANGFPKELYEPLWDDLHDRLKVKDIAISSIWIADVAQQGASGVLNEDKLGNDPSWADHPRDLFLMVNYFRKYMKRPMIGVGHSMGGNNLVNLSLMHPRLFTTLILIDPVIQRYASIGGNNAPAKASVGRRDIWASRREAEKKLKGSKFYQAWDARVLQKWVEHGLRDLPTRLHPKQPSPPPPPALSADPSSGLAQPLRDDVPVTLTTTKHQEVLTFLRANFPTPEYPNPGQRSNPITHPDANLDSPPVTPFYSAVPIATFKRLPHLRPSVLYVFGSESFLSTPVMKADKMAHTGTGAGGSGGVKAGRVAEVTFKGIGHLIPMEVVGQTADACADWLSPEMLRWRRLEDAEREEWENVSREEKAKFSREYETVMKSDWMDEVQEAAKKAKL